MQIQGRTFWNASGSGRDNNGRGVNGKTKQVLKKARYQALLF